MNKRNNLKLLEFHRNLYEKAIVEANDHGSIDSPTILQYADDFYKSLPKNFTDTDLNAVLTDIEQSDILLYGDFHTHWQTQKGLIRILESYITLHPDRDIVLAVEMFRAADQEVINRFLNDEITEEELLHETEYERIWGFPWENYRTIVEFAKDNSIQLMGINSDNAGRDSLKKRDVFAATILDDVIQGYPDSLCICLIGEFHLGDNHLTEQLRGFNRKVTRILTNIDQFYFARRAISDYSRNEYLYLKPGLYCLLNSPPWIKWQSYSLWAEMKSAERDDELEEFQTHASFDIDCQILSVLMHLTEFLNLSFREIELSNFHSYWNISGKDVSSFYENKGVASYTQSLIEQRLQIDNKFFIPEKRIVLLNKVSLNHIAEAAGQILFNMTHPIQNMDSESELFFHRTMMISSGLFASKILNPRFKYPDIHQFESDLARLARKKLSDGDRVYRNALRYIVKKYYSFLVGKTRIHSNVIEKDKEANGIYSLMLGQLLATETYKYVMHPHSNQEFGESLFFVSHKGSMKSNFQFMISTLFKG